MRRGKLFLSFVLIMSTISCASQRIRSPVYFLRYAEWAFERYEEGATTLEGAIKTLNGYHRKQTEFWIEKAEQLKKSRKRNMVLFYAMSFFNAGVGLSIPLESTGKNYDDAAGLYLGLTTFILSTLRPSIRADMLEKFYLELTKEINKRNAEWMELYDITEENLKKKVKKYKEDDEAYTEIAKKYYIPVSQK